MLRNRPANYRLKTLLLRGFRTGLPRNLTLGTTQ
jgi:hypothetical protein